MEELLLTNQIQQYKFLANGSTQVDGVDDAQMFTATRVRIRECAMTTECYYSSGGGGGGGGG